MIYLNRKLFQCLLMIAVFFTNCTPKEIPIPETGNETLDLLIHSTSFHTTIELDDVIIDTLSVSEETMLGQEYASTLPYPVHIGQVADLLKIGDSLYIADQQQATILVMDEHGTFHRKIGRQGEGPGEFNFLTRIIKNSSHIFAIDNGNARIQVYDYQFNLMNTFDQVIHGITKEQISVNDSSLYLPLNPFEHDELVAVHQVESPFHQEGSFWPRLIPAGMQPSAYNIHHLVTNASNRMALVYTGLPYIFMLNPEKELEHVIYVESETYHQLENPPVSPVPLTSEDSFEAYGVDSFIRNIVLKDDGSMYFSIRNNLYFLEKGGNNYLLKKGWHVVHSDSGLRENTPDGIHASSIIIEDNTLFLASIFEEYVYRFVLN